MVRTPYFSIIKGESLENPITRILEGEPLRVAYYSDSKGESLARHATTE